MPIDNLSKITSRSGINTTILLEAGNANVTGIVTAAGFDGPFTGGGGNNAGIVTAVGGLHVGTAGTVLHAINDSNVAKVGIGTTIPTAKLEISHPTHTSLVRLKRTTGNAGDFVMQIGGSNPGVIFDAVGISSDFIFQTQGTEIMRIDSLNKEVGIGTDNPFCLLDVFRKATGTNKDIFSVRSHSGAFLVECSDVAASNPTWALRTFSGEDLVFSPGGQADVHEKVRIKASTGRVGINTTDLTQSRLDVFEGTGTNSSKALVRFQKDHTETVVTGARGAVDQYPHALILENQNNSANTGTVSLSFSKYSAGVQSQAIIAGIQQAAGQMALTFNTELSNTMHERLRIDSDGRVGMGLTSTSGSTCDPDDNGLLIRHSSTFQTNHGHIMLTGDGATVGEGPQIVFSESGSGGNFAGAYIGHVRRGGNSQGDLVFGTRDIAGDADTVPDERLRITKDGRVGINSSIPTNTLVVREPTDNNSSLQLFRESTGGDISSVIWATNSGSQAQINYRGGGGSVGMQFYTGGTGSSNLRAIIDTSGNVGIGTDDPTGKLEINTASSTEMITLNASNANFARIGHNSASGTAVLDVRSEGYIRLLTGGNNERIRISATNGSVGIGTDELQTHSTFYHTLNVVGDNTSQGSVVKIKKVKNALSNDTYTLQIDSTAHTSNVASAGPFGVDVNSGRAFTINGFGRVGIQTTRPDMALHVRSDSDDVARFQSTNASNGPAITLDHIGGSAADDDIVGKIVFNGQDDATTPNSTTYADIRCITSDVSDGTETAHLDFGTRALNAFNPILRLAARSTASAPTYSADDMNGIILDTYNAGGGSGYERFFSFIAKSAGNTDSNIAFWTEKVGGSPIERLRITKNGHVSIISGNLEFANGAGIDFSNVPDGSRTIDSDGNKLDDYEEGSFTPYYYTQNSLLTAGYVSQDGKYTKIGRFVHFQIYLRLSSKSGGSGHLRIYGLPFTSSDASGAAYGGGVVAYTNNWDNDAIDRIMVGSGSDQVQLFVGTSSGTNVNAGAGNLNSDTQLRIFGSYQV